jgi:hypothetical protein
MEQTGITIWKPPTIQELIALADERNNTHSLETMAAIDNFNMAINVEPPREWILEHPTIQVTVDYKKDQTGKYELNSRGEKIAIKAPLQYIPIDKQRLLGKRFFGIVEVEIKGVYQHFQSEVVIVRLHYRHPILREKLFMDGIGGMGVQTDAGFSASDLTKIKFDGVMKAAPSAASYAEKNAYDKLGRIFGGEIQKNAIRFNQNIAMFSDEVFKPTIEQIKALFDEKKHLLNEKELKSINRVIDNKEENSYIKMYNFLNTKS